jgi:predicted ester cyclase
MKPPSWRSRTTWHRASHSGIPNQPPPIDVGAVPARRGRVYHSRSSVAARSTVVPGGRAVPTEENKAVVRRWFAGAYQADAIVDELIAPDYVLHIPPNPDVRGPEALELFNRQTRTAFPDLRLTVDGLVAEGDMVVARWTMRGTHLGEMRGGIAPTGKPFAVTGTTTNRLAGGKIAEGWASWGWSRCRAGPPHLQRAIK